MFKKFLFSILSLVLVMGAYKADAFLNKIERLTYEDSVTYSNLYVVSAADFFDKIYLLSTSTPNTNITFRGTFNNGPYISLSPNTTAMTSSTGTATLTAEYQWPIVVLSTTSPTFFTASFKAEGPTGSKDSGEYKAEVRYISTTPAAKKADNTNITEGSSVTKGTTVNFTCTNSSEMYYGPSGNWPTGATKVASDYGPHSNTSEYTLTYSTTLNTVGNYRLQCANIGGDNTRKELNFSVIEDTSCPTPGHIKDSTGYCHAPCSTGYTWNESSKQCVQDACPTGQTREGSPSGTCHVPCTAGQTWNDTTKQCVTTSCGAGQELIGGTCRDVFDIINISSSPNQAGAEATFTWTSTADTCNVYTNDKTTRLNPGASSKSGNNFSATVPVQNMPASAGNYLYYIKCYSASKFTSSNLEKDGSDPDHTGWKSYTVNLSSANEVDFTISNITSSPNHTNTVNTFTWNSDADTSCGLYEYGDGYLYNAGGPVKIVDATRSGNTWTATLPTNRVPSSPANIAYYIGCYSETRLASESNGVVRDYYNGHRGWKDYTAPYTINEANTFNITGVNSSPNIAGTANTFNWVSQADTCNVYTNDKTTRLNPGASSKSGNNFSATVPTQNMPASAGNYLYYIKCYSASLNPASSLEMDMSDPNHTGWQGYNVALTSANCPTGQTYQGGSCVDICASGYTYNASTDGCELTSCPTGQEIRNGECVTIYYFDIYGFGVTPKETGKDNTFTFSSQADKCDVYSYEWDESGGHAGVKLNTGTASRSGQDFSAIVPAANMPTTAGNYGYYIRCESTDDSYEATPNARVSWESDPSVGWRYWTVYVNQGLPACPAGQVRSSSNGVCHTPCPSGYTWNEAGGTCGNPNPSCTWSDPATKTLVQCNVPYVCENGNPPELRVYYKDGHYDSINPPTDPFTWDTNQYQYQFYCGATNLIPVAPLRKTYTHFLTFNVSASNVQKGTKVNLNWSVEDPNITCKIEGVSIKNPTQVVFNSKAVSQLDAKISTSTGSVQTTMRNLATGDYNTIMGQYWTVNQSTRFTASCTDTGTYKPGYYQLVRDIYVTGEEER